MKKVLSLLKPYTGTLLLSIFFATLNTVMQLLLPLYTKNILSEGILAYDTQRLWELCLIMLGFTLAGVVFSIANTYFSTKTSVNYAMSLRNFMFGRVSYLSQSDIDKVGVASLVTRTTNDVRQVHDIILSTLKSLVPIPIMLTGGLVMAIKINAELARLALVCIPFLALFAVILIAIIMPMYSKMQKLVDKFNQVMREKIGGIRVIRAFNKTEYEDGRFADTNKQLTGISLRASRIMAGLMPVLTIFMYSLVCVVVYKSVMRANTMDPLTQREEILATIPNMYAFISYFTLVITAVASVVSIIVSIPQAVISGRRIKTVIEAVSDIRPPEHPIVPEQENKGTLEFRGVSFKHKSVPEEKKKKRRFGAKKWEKPPEKSNFALGDISFESHRGETTAIIGVTGSGKSTLVSLIPRLYDVDMGEVRIAGVDVKNLERSEIDSRVAFIPQQAFLFSGTLADNLRFGKPDATDAEIWRALEIAQAKSFVAALPDGINSFVSQAGKNFSGGQKQRLAIARAIIKNTEIIVFDDSFSALDLATDARLRASLRENLSDADIIIVAQRVGTVLNADRIIVLDNGRAVGIGTHRELINSCEAYRDIVATQLSEEALGEAQTNE